jgi:hypothetical protein
VAAGVVPNMTAVAELKSVPVTARAVPPASGPASGLTPETVGTGA